MRRRCRSSSPRSTNEARASARARRAAVGQPLGGDRVGESRREDAASPGAARARGSCSRADVADALGAEALQRPDRRAVVAVLAVVVVLDHERAVRARPTRAAPRGARPGGRRRWETGARASRATAAARPLERVGRIPSASTRRGPARARPRQDRAVLPDARLLDGHPPGPARREQPGDQRDAWVMPADTTFSSGGRLAAGAAEIVGQDARAVGVRRPTSRSRGVIGRGRSARRTRRARSPGECAALGATPDAGPCGPAASRAPGAAAAAPRRPLDLAMGVADPRRATR